MSSHAELDAGFKAVRSLIDARAGWYAHLISDDMVREVVCTALAAAERVSGETKQPGAKP